MTLRLLLPLLLAFSAGAHAAACPGGESYEKARGEVQIKDLIGEGGLDLAGALRIRGEAVYQRHLLPRLIHLGMRQKQLVPLREQPTWLDRVWGRVREEVAVHGYREGLQRALGATGGVMSSPTSTFLCVSAISPKLKVPVGADSAIRP